MSSKLGIVVASINFAPDHAGIANYSTDLAVFLAEQGHEVTILTGFPYYPQWKKRPEDKWRLFARESYRGVNVLRSYLFVPSKPAAWKRLVHEVSFCAFALLHSFRCKRADLVIVITPPLFLTVVGRFLAWRWHCPWITHIQDLPLDAAQELGMLKPGLGMRSLQTFERRVYQGSSAVITLSAGMRGMIAGKGVAPEKTSIVPNWINLAAPGEAMSPDDFLRRHPMVRHKFTVGYAGNVGKKQGVDVLVELAVELKGDERFHFYIVGDGADRQKLERIVREKGLANLDFWPFLPSSEYRAFIDLLDLVFIVQKGGVGNIFFPSKLLEIMARSRPILLSADLTSELAQTITSSGAGIAVPYGDVTALRQAVSRLSGNQALLKEMGLCGRRQVQVFERKHVLEDYEDLMWRLVDRYPRKGFAAL